jgi:hypothetical protein
MSDVHYPHLYLLERPSISKDFIAATLPDSTEESRCRIQTCSLPCYSRSIKTSLPLAAIMELTLWVEQRGSGEVGGNVRGALETISKNEEFITMTLALLMAPE